MNGYTEVSECPHCTGTLENYITAISAPAMVVQFAGGDLNVMTVVPYVKCSGCGLVAQSPRITDERLDHYYSSGLYRQSVGMSQEAMDADELNRARDVAQWLKARFVYPEIHVDIGSSRGYLLQEVGAHVQRGYDRNPNYGKMTTKKSDIKPCDLLSSIHVLEHVPYPMEDLHWYRSLCKQLVIEVPGENCKGGPLRFAHLFYFPPDVLVSMLKAAGFTVVDMVTEPNTRILAR